MTKEQAQEIIEAHNIQETLENKDDVECLEENNPRLLDAYRAIYKFAYGEDA